MRNVKNLVICFACVLIIFSITNMGYAAEESIPKIRIVPSEDQVQVGDTLDVAIWLQGFIGDYEDIEGLEILVNYDPTLLALVSDGDVKFKEDAVFTTGNPTTYANKISNEGTISFAQSLQPGSTTGYFSGNVKLGTMTFKALKEGEAALEQKKSIIIMPGNPGINIKHQKNNPTIIIGEGNAKEDKVVTVGEAPTQSKAQPTQDQVLAIFGDHNDILSITWAVDATAYLTERKIINGMNDGKFYPFKNMTRAEFAKVCVVALGLDMVQQKTATFTDVNKSDWSYDYIETATKHGLINGKMKDGAKVFDPKANITRAEIATIFSRILKQINGLSEATEQGNNHFKDVSENHWAKGDILYLFNMGIIKGRGEDQFAPQENATRAEVSVLIYRLLHLEE